MGKKVDLSDGVPPFADPEPEASNQPTDWDWSDPVPLPQPKQPTAARPPQQPRSDIRVLNDSDQMIRKTVPVRYSQRDELAQLAAELQRAKADHRAEANSPTKRITENTLIRVAIDSLLRNKSSLRGSDEQELLASLTQIH